MALEPENEWAENYPSAVAWGVYDKRRAEVVSVSDTFDDMDEPWADNFLVVPLVMVLPDPTDQEDHQ